MNRLSKILIIPLLIVMVFAFGMDAFAEIHSKWVAGDLIFYDATQDILTIKDDTDGLIIGETTAGVDFKVWSDTASTYLLWDADADDLLLVGTATKLNVAGTTEASASTGAIYTDGGICAKKKVYVGTNLVLVAGPLDVSTAATDIKVKSNTDSALEFVINSTAFIDIDTRNTVTDITNVMFTAIASEIASGSSIWKRTVGITPGTTTLTGTTTCDNMSGLALYIAQPTVTSGETVTVTKASTVYIVAEPVGSSVTITAAYALEIASGDFLTAGKIIVDDTTTGSASAGSIQTDGGLSVALKAYVSGGVFIVANVAATTFLDFEIGTSWTSGTLINADFGASTTLDGAATLLNLDCANVNAASEQNVIGIDLNLPQLTISNNTVDVIGIEITAQGAMDLTVGGDATWVGIDIATPAISEDVGSVDARGVNVVGGTLTSGTAYGFTLSGAFTTGIDMTGTHATAGISIVTTMAEHDDYAIYIATSCADTSDTVIPLYVNSVTTAACKARAAEFVLAPTVPLGQWANAVKAYLNLGTVSGGSGLVAGLCTEVKLPDETMTGTITALEIELVSTSGFVANEGLGSNCVSFINANLSGTDKGEIDDHGYFLNIQGLESLTTQMLYNNTLKCVIGSTKLYLPFSTAEGSYTTAYPIVTSSRTGFRSTATFEGDTNRTDYAFAVGYGHTDTNELSVTMVAADGLQNFDPFAMNINILGADPQTLSTTNLLYTKLTHDYANMANLRLKCADFTVEVGKHIKDAYAYQGEIDLTGDVTIGGEVCVLGLVLDVGTGTVSGSVNGIHMALRGSAMSACQAYGFYMSVGDSATATNAIYIETLSGATIGTSIRLGSASGTTITKGLYITGSGTFTTGIDIDAATTAIDLGACTTGINVAANTVMPQFLTIGTLANPMHWDGVASNILIYQENLDTSPGVPTPITANKFSLSATQSGATTAGRLECFRAEVKTYSTTAVTADMRALVGQVEFSGDMTYIGNSGADYAGAYGVIASIWSGSNVTANTGNLGKMYPLGIFFGLETNTSLSGEDAYIYIYNYGKVCPNSVMKLYNASTPQEPTYLFDKAHSTLGSASGPFYPQDVNPHSAPADASLGADGHIKILIGATPYYIPFFANLE